MRASMVVPNPDMVDKNVESQMAFVQNLIDALRNIRGEMGIAPSKEINVVMKSSPTRSEESIRKYEGYLQRLARVASFSFVDDTHRSRHSATAVVDGEEIFVPLEGLIDLSVEQSRLAKEIERVAELREGVKKKLDNPGFVAKAPRDVVEKEKDKMESFSKTLEKLRKSHAALQ